MNTIVKDDVSFHKFIHEIKNPLAVCKGYLEIFTNKESSITKENINVLKDEIKRTLALINDYSINKSQNNLIIEEIDLSVLLEDVKNILSTIYKNNNSKIIIIDNDEYYIRGDYNKLKQVFINILKNSLEAKSSNKLLSVIKIKDYHDYYEISVIDNGIGMTKECLSQIGKEFYTTKKNGTGLGVSLIKDIISLHSGTIKYKSSNTLGTKVMIKLPKEKSPKTFNNSN